MNLQQKTELAHALIASNRPTHVNEALLDQAIADMTNAFLRWPLPESVNADGCATRKGKGRTGTNLMSVGETLTMMQEVVRPTVTQLITTYDSDFKNAADFKDATISSLLAERDQLRYHVSEEQKHRLELATLVKRMIVAIRKKNRNDSLSYLAMDYLVRNHLDGETMRDQTKGIS